MTAFSLLLILIAAFSHAGWNLLLKRSGNKELFVWWFSVSGAVLLAPLGITLYWLNPITTPGHWFVLASMLMQIFYLILLGRSYSRGDLSLVYPIARGIGPMLVPLVAVLTLGERIELPAVVGIALVVVGIFTISWWGHFREIVASPVSFFRDSGILYAILTGGTITVYSLLDKRGVQHVQPFLYMYLITVGVSIGLLPYIIRNYSLAQIKNAWAGSFWAIPAAGLLSYLAYTAILTAFTQDRVSYIVPAREVSIVVGVLAGVWLLKESFGAGRVLGSCLIVAGLALIALSP